MNRRRHRRAYSLVEVLLASALVGVLVAGSLTAMSGSARTWLEASQVNDAQALAHELLEEILAQSYADPDTTDDPDLQDFGPESDETVLNRSMFDDVDNYDDWSESPPQTRTGSDMAAFNGWTRSVVVQKLKKRKVNDFRNDDQDDHESRQITVTVTDAGGTPYVVEAVRARLGGMEQPIGVTSEFVTGVSVVLQANNADPIYQAARLLNHAEVPATPGEPVSQ